jgi:GR25 family glycosyltransferase involved in LPS biosynthesis
MKQNKLKRLFEDHVKKEANGWDYFDRLYCISLQERGDRRRSALKEFSKVGLADRVDFEIGERHPFNNEQGVYESHMVCLRKGLEAGAKNIVIFEDDVEFDRFDPERLKSCTDFLRQHPEWKVLLLGALIRSSRKTTNPCIQKVRYQSLSHAYALNRDYAETLAYTPWQGIVNDTLFRPLTDDVYALYPMCAFQNNFTSDNYKYPGLVVIRRLLGGLKRIQKANEFYHRHKFGIYAIQIIVILLVLFVFSAVFKGLSPLGF